MTVCYVDSALARIFLAVVAISLLGDQAVAQDATSDAPAVKSDTTNSDTADVATEATEADPGQADLDEAIIKRIDAESEEELEAVTVLLVSALKKGLDEENEAFAKKMLGSVLMQRSQGLAGQMMRARGRRAIELRDRALDRLQEAVRYDPTLVEAYLLIARLNLLPDGDKGAITEATSKAIELLEDDPVEQSAAYVLRALTQDDDAKKLADLNAAAEKDPENVEAFQARAALRLQMNDVEGAIADLELVLLKDPTNQAVAEAAVRKLFEMNRLDDAVELITKILAAKPSEGMYRMRANVYRFEQKFDEAMSDINKAIAMQPKDPITLLQRAEIALDRDDVKSAKEDFQAAKALAPQFANADPMVELRLRIALQENRLADAINDGKLLAERAPEMTSRQLRLATLYSLDQRPRKAIEILTGVLEQDPMNVSVLRSRADALLSVGDHGLAIEDYEKAIEAMGDLDAAEVSEIEKMEASGIYNNLSWVLATSPDDSVRDGERALKYGKKAAELSDYEAPHILSTLAAAYAEQGDFEKAVEWSSKAVELGDAEKDSEDHDQLEQLQNELDQYKQGKPWREKQETEENSIPILSPEDLIDT